ncbi:MAG: tetratricopeptide repeat protein [Phycisphaerales bacterium]|nr:MAG: tetratricopeptide repeat protein [Phycisphaerales bacterium]
MPSIQQLQKLLEADPNDTFVLYGLAQEHAKAGETEAAIQHYDRVLALDPHYCYAYFHKAKTLEEDTRTDEAIAVLKQGLAASKQANDAKATAEIAQFLDELT